MEEVQSVMRTKRRRLAELDAPPAAGTHPSFSASHFQVCSPPPNLALCSSSVTSFSGLQVRHLTSLQRAANPFWQFYFDVPESSYKLLKIGCEK